MIRLFFFILFLIIISGCKDETNNSNNDDQDILTRLQNIPGATVLEIPPSAHFSRLFEMYFTQLVDHKNDNGSTFQQKIYVGHVAENLPVVLETEGYSRDNFKMRDLAPAMQCNQITIEHRYNGSSKPNPIDWQYLTIKQAADDVHEIVEKIKKIYSAAWVSSGRSKGGEAAIFHRRFYPDDVDGTVAIVAPLLFSENDQRIEEYLNTVGDAGCRNKIKYFQRNMLINADSIAALFPGYVSWVNDNYGTDFTFLVSYSDIVKYAAIEYPFEFWSSPFHDCSSIPSLSATPQDLFDHLMEVMDIFLFYSDYGIDFWRGWYYQAQTEIGDFKFNTEHLDYLLGDIKDLADLYDFGAGLVFDPMPMQDINNWVQTEGDKIIFIYGENDPWTIAQFEISTLDVLKIINPATKHETSLYDLSPSDKNLIIEKLSDWLDYREISF